jgi:microcystin-dependent protein
MAEPFIGEIILFAGNFAPAHYALCDGQLMAISQNTALFSLLGTQFGGNGTSNFQLPNLQGSVPIGIGQGPGLSPYVIGQVGGAATVTLTQQQMPAHTHNIGVTSHEATQPSASNHLPAQTPTAQYVGSTPSVTLSSALLAPNGGSQPHENRQPFLTLNFCIALFGVFPSRS